MVLKKSNTPFNSGATQKSFSRSAYKAVHEKPSEAWLTITLKGLPVIFDEKNPSTEHVKALEKIYGYLEFLGPTMKTFNDAVHDKWNKPVRTLSFSLDKRDLHHIPERIDRLMTEKNFLEGKSGFAEIRISKVQKIADRTTFHKKKCCILNQEVRKPLKISRQEKRKKVKGKTRGLQRRHLLAPAKPDTEDEEGSDNEEAEFIRKRQKKVVEFELQEEDLMDARIFGYRSNYNLKAKSRKPKTNAKRSFDGILFHKLNTCNSQDLEREMENVYLEVLDSDLQNDINDNADYMTGERLEKVGNHRVDLDDLFVLSPERHSHRKKCVGGYHKEINSDRNDGAQFVNVNTASSQVTLKHQKGSFQFIERPCDVSVNIERVTLFENDESGDAGDEIKKLYNDVSDSSVQINNEKTQIPVTLVTFETRDTFLALDLQFPKELQDQIQSPLLRSKGDTIPINGGSLVLGNCYPPVFSVNLVHKDLGSDTEWSLVGTSASGVSYNRNVKWEVTLKSAKQCKRDNDIKESFFYNLDMIKSSDSQFEDVVKIALTSIQLASKDFIKDKNNKSSRCMYKNSKKDVLSVPSYDNAPSHVCSIEEAVARLRAVQTGKVHDSTPFLSVTKGQISISGESVECDICLNICDTFGQKDSGIITLLPCNHSFCSECWRSHIFYHLMSGDTEIKCMHTDCKETLNETMMKALIPENYLSKLYLRRQEKCIDTSPLCQWCPRTKCNKVAMISDTGPHVQQFGCCVVCDCGSCWCFSCQSQPHWPVSCSQAAAYRKLVLKIKDEIPMDVTCNVDLKPCPGCRYPIEKDEGCPYMCCSLCEFDFCWICLQPSAGHSAWYCTVDESNTFITYELHNDIINNFPLKFFRNAIEMMGKDEAIRQEEVKGWLIGLETDDCYKYKIKFSFRLSVQLEEPELFKRRAVHLAKESLTFLKETYIFLEHFYLLFSFALLNKDKDNSKVFHLSIQGISDRLASTALRLEECVVGKSCRQLLVVEERCHIMLAAGREMLEKLKGRVTSFQKLSKDVPAEPIGHLDPDGFYRIK